MRAVTRKIERLWTRVENIYDEFLIRRLVAGPPIRPGDWLIDLGMPTPRAVRIKRAYARQQEKRRR